MEKERIIKSPFGESNNKSNVINTLITTENECYVIIPAIPEGRKILVTKELAAKIELNWENGNMIYLKWNGGSIRNDNVYLTEPIDLEVENPMDDVFTGEQ